MQVNGIKNWLLLLYLLLNNSSLLKHRNSPLNVGKSYVELQNLISFVVLISPTYFRNFLKVFECFMAARSGKS